jgi:hypothetical protein
MYDEVKEWCLLAERADPYRLFLHPVVNLGVAGLKGRKKLPGIASTSIQIYSIGTD